MSKKGYWIAHVDVTDPESYKDYIAANAVAFRQYGGRFLVRGGASETDDHFWRNRVNLPQQEWRTLRDFIFFRSAVFRRTALHDVTDVNVFPLQTHRFDHLGEKFSGAADEWKTLHVFIVPRAFADKNQFGIGIAVAENDGVSGFVQFAARAFAEIGANLGKRVAGNFVKCFEQRRPRGDRQRI